jgi:hypothetical protein
MMVVLFVGLCAAVGRRRNGSRRRPAGAGHCGLLNRSSWPMATTSRRASRSRSGVALPPFRRGLPQTPSAAASAAAASLGGRAREVLLRFVLPARPDGAAAYRRRRTAGTGGAFPWFRLALLPAIVALAIWAAYGFRFDPHLEPPPPADGSWGFLFPKGSPLPFSPVGREDAWKAVLHDRDDNPRTDLSAVAANLARRTTPPRAYLYASPTRPVTRGRRASPRPFLGDAAHHFPVASVKTPAGAAASPGRGGGRRRRRGSR